MRVFVSETRGAGRKTHLAPDCSAPVPRPIRENESRWAPHRVPRGTMMTHGSRRRVMLALFLTTVAMASTVSAAGVPSMRSTAADSITVTARGVCATAMENRHLAADSAGGVCTPLAVDAATGCCLEPKRQVSKEMCAESCSERGCCDAYATCVVCCHDDLARRIADAEGSEEKEPIVLNGFTPMHPAMWRRWLITHDPNGITKLEGEPARGESFSGKDDHAVPPFDYCKHRCRTNSGVTKYENSFQDPKHHCFGETYVERLGADDTLSPGREKNHDEAGDWKIAPDGRVVALGLAKIQPRPSDEFNGGPDADDDVEAVAGANSDVGVGMLSKGLTDGLASVSSLIHGGGHDKKGGEKGRREAYGLRERYGHGEGGTPGSNRPRVNMNPVKRSWVFGSLTAAAESMRGMAAGGDAFTMALELVAVMLVLLFVACCCLLRDRDFRRTVRNM